MTSAITSPGMTASTSASASTSKSSTSTASPGTLATTVKHMMGMLWYEMLSAMNTNGFSEGALGAGSGDFQNMFLWNLAQNDFGKYDTQLTAAAVKQLGGGTAAGAAAPSETVARAAGGTVSGLSLATGMPASGAIAAMLVAANASSTGATVPQTIGAMALQITDASGGNAPAATAGVNSTAVDRAVAYAKQLWPQISAAAQTLGVSPVAILAQSALETGWGAATIGNNFFGIKAAPGQGGSERLTHEMVGGVLQTQTASFRDYNTAAASVADYVGVIQSGFQPAVGQTSVADFAWTLQANGYATDQNYAAKIISIAQSPLMQQVLSTLQGQSSTAASE